MDDLFPVLPFRSELYGPDELFRGFDPEDPCSYARTLDFRAYHSTRLAPNREVGMLRALHDQCITEARNQLLAGRRVVAIMGGHALQRGEAAYRQVAAMARTFATRGFVVVSGGGPGAMEATHLGALLCRQPEAVLDAAVDRLAEQATFPEEAKLVVGDDGTVDEAVLAALHAWQVPAFDVLGWVPPEERGLSLSVPTWFYGQEPPTPFASHVAKYFSNPLREDGLLAVAIDGVVFAPGRAGTVQEVFQDAAQNAYRVFHGRFSPMAFLDTGGCWTERLPVLPVLRGLFGAEDFDRYVRTSADPDDLIAFLDAGPGPEAPA